MVKLVSSNTTFLQQLDGENQEKQQCGLIVLEEEEEAFMKCFSFEMFDTIRALECNSKETHW